MQAIWDKVKITVKTIRNKVKVTVRAIWNKVKEKPLLSILRVLLTLTFVAFVCVLLFECAGTYISKLLGLSDKNEALKFLGIGMGGLLVALLVFSKIKDDLPVSVLIFLIITLGVVFLVVMVSDCPKWIFNRLGIDRTDEPKYEALKFLGIGMGGILIALQALMSYRRAKAMEDAVEKTEQGQRQERLKNAIEHLGDDKEPMRLGGTYELLHLAKDTKKLRQTVLDILCANIRRTTGDGEYRRRHKSKPSKEVQGLLTLLFVQEYEVFKGCHINLQESWLNGADLQEARLWKATLIGAHLQKADLCRAHLQRANLAEAHLEEAFLSEAYLQGANLRSAYLQGAILREAHMQGAILEGIYLQEAYMQEAHMQGVGLYAANMQGAYLQGVRLQGAYLDFVGTTARSHA